MSNALFDEGDEEEDGGAQFGLNKAYANRFEQRKKKQEMARLRERYGDDDSSDASTEDEDGSLLTPALDLQIMRAVDKIRQKKPEVYAAGTSFYAQDAGEDAGEPAGGERARKQRKGEKLTLKRQLLEDGADALASDDEDGDQPPPSTGKLAYDREQRELRAAFVETGDGDGDGDNFLSVSSKPAAERGVGPDEYAAWLRDQAGAADESVTLRRYLSGGEELNDEDRFLRDYILHAKWKRGAGAESDEDGEGEEGARAAPEPEGRAGEDEDFSDREDDFERAYNFRFEEPGAERVVSHPRSTDASIRKQAEAGRKREAAEARRARKEEARAQKRQELQRLKNLKKQEVLERLRAIQEVSGAAVPLSEVDLSGEFDPEDHDRQMAAMFSDDFYAQEDAEYAHEQEAWDGDDWGEGGGGGGGGKRGKRGRGSMESLAKELSAHGSDGVRKTAQQYMDEYYGLDYEDLIGGEIPTRFKYRTVDPSGFGMTDEELLYAEPKELNKRVPLKYLKSSYAKWDERKLKGRAKRVQWDAKREERAARHAPRAPGGGRPPKGQPKKVAKAAEGGEAPKSTSTKKVASGRKAAYSNLKGTPKKKLKTR